MMKFEVMKEATFSIPMNRNADINVKYGDLFANKDGYIVITVDEFIETDLDYLKQHNRIGNLHSIFLEKFFKDKSSQLEELVNKDLSRQKLPIKVSKDTRRLPYPMGTTVIIEKDGYKFLLLVFHTQDGIAPFIDFPKSLIGLLGVVCNDTFNRSVYLPVLGSEFAHAKLSTIERSLEEAIIINMILTIMSFYGDRRYSRLLMSDINIIIHEATKIPVDLCLIRNVFIQDSNKWEQ